MSHLTYPEHVGVVLTSYAPPACPSRGGFPESQLEAALERLDKATIRAAGFCTKTPDCPYCEVRAAVEALRALLVPPTMKRS